MKKILTGLAALALLTVLASFSYFYASNRDPDRVDAFKVVTATKAYGDALKAQGLPLPASVSLKELVKRGLLAETDVSGFAGMDVTVSLAPGDNLPQDVLMRARLADGSEMVALGDGSVQQARK